MAKALGEKSISVNTFSLFMLNYMYYCESRLAKLTADVADKADKKDLLWSKDKDGNYITKN